MMGEIVVREVPGDLFKLRENLQRQSVVLCAGHLKHNGPVATHIRASLWRESELDDVERLCRDRSCVTNSVTAQAARYERDAGC